MLKDFPIFTGQRLSNIPIPCSHWTAVGIENSWAKRAWDIFTNTGCLVSASFPVTLWLSTSKELSNSVLYQHKCWDFPLSVQLRCLDMWISTNSWCEYRSAVRCWFQKLRQNSHTWCQKTLKPTWSSFLFGNRSVPSFPTEKDCWSQWVCAFLAAIRVSQHGISHGQEDFSDIHF